MSADQAGGECVEVSAEVSAAVIDELIDAAAMHARSQLVRSLCAVLPPARLPCGRRPLLQQGERWTDAYFVESGLLRVHSVEPDGRTTPRASG